MLARNVRERHGPGQCGYRITKRNHAVYILIAFPSRRLSGAVLPGGSLNTTTAKQPTQVVSASTFDETLVPIRAGFWVAIPAGQITQRKLTPTDLALCLPVVLARPL